MLKEGWPLYGFTQVGNKEPRPGTDLKFWVGKKSNPLFVGFPNKIINQVYHSIASLLREYPEDVEKQLEEARKLSDKQRRSRTIQEPINQTKKYRRREKTMTEKSMIQQEINPELKTESFQTTVEGEIKL
ncbi:hypothetical protein C9439_03905 [archaeon SCG-AAA382B04]|nr:hypothetical protein C9439_03905 [archaeon SCG-AAA382B04]